MTGDFNGLFQYCQGFRKVEMSKSPQVHLDLNFPQSALCAVSIPHAIPLRARKQSLADHLSGRIKKVWETIVLLKKQPCVGQTIRSTINHQNW